MPKVLVLCDPSDIERMAGAVAEGARSAGMMVVEVADQHIEVRPGDFFYDASMPHRLSFDSPFEHIALRLPNTLVNQRWRPLSSRGSFLLKPRDCLGRSAAASLDATAANIRRMSSEELSIALEAAIDLFSAGASRSKSEYDAGGGASVPFARTKPSLRTRHFVPTQLPQPCEFLDGH